MSHFRLARGGHAARRETMTRAVLVPGLTLVAVARVSATDNWPLFRGPVAGVAAHDPALPDVWSETQNVVLEGQYPRLGLELACCVGGSCLPHVRGQHRPGGRSRPRVSMTQAMSTARWRSSAAQRWVSVRRRLQDRRAALGARGAQRAAADHQARQEQLCVGNTGHGRRTGVRVFASAALGWSRRWT